MDDNESEEDDPLGFSPTQPEWVRRMQAERRVPRDIRDHTSALRNEVKRGNRLMIYLTSAILVVGLATLGVTIYLAFR